MVEDRIERSRLVLEGWEARTPSGRTADLLRMIRQEINALEAIAQEKPRLAERTAYLIGRWQQLALRVKLTLN